MRSRLLTPRTFPGAPIGRRADGRLIRVQGGGAVSSLIQTQWVRDAFKGAILPKIQGGTPDTLNAALFSNSLTPSQDTDPATYGVAPYNASEVSGTGWAAGGVALGSVTMTLVTGYGVMLDANDVSQSGTTLTAARGALVYDNSLSPKAALVLVNFGADYSTAAGTFGITWDVNGIFRIQLH